MSDKINPFEDPVEPYKFESEVNLKELSDKHDSDYLLRCEEELMEAFNDNITYIKTLASRGHRKCIIPMQGQNFPSDVDNIPWGFKDKNWFFRKEYEIHPSFLARINKNLKLSFGEECKLTLCKTYRRSLIFGETTYKFAILSWRDNY